MARPKVTWPIIRPRTNQINEVTSYTVDCGIMDGRRIRFSFKTRAEAEGKAEQMRIARKNEGASAFGMTSRDRIDAEAGLALLARHGATIREAAEFYVRNIHVIQAAKTAPEVTQELIESKRTKGKAERYVRDLRNRLEAFSGNPDFADRALHTINAPEIDAWLTALPISPVTQNNYRRVLGVLFNFAVKRRYALRNPIQDVEQAQVEVTKPGILSVLEAEALLRASPSSLRAAVAIALFAGLRPNSELWRLDWKNVDLEERVIDVTASKNNISHRFVTVTDNLVAWLKPQAKRHGLVSPTGESYYSLLQQTRAKAKLTSWPNDCLRHTFASMHYAAFKDAGTTSQQLGHNGNLTMFKRHYYNRVKPTDAAAFWEIRP